MSVTNEVFINGQVVNAVNMNTITNNPINYFTAIYSIAPSICNGIGNINNKFGQIGTTNQFLFTTGFLRFNNQPNPINSAISTTMCDCEGSTITVTCPSSNTQYYIVAKVTLISNNANEYTVSAIISPIALTLEQIELTPNLYLIICAINNIEGVYSVFLDIHCAYNYGYSSPQFPDIIDNSVTGSVTIGGKVVGGTQKLEALAANGNSALVAAYGISDGGAFFGITNSNSIISGFSVSSIGRPYINGDHTVTNQFNVATIGDVTHHYSTGNVVGGGIYFLNMQKIRLNAQNYSISISGYIQNVPYIGTDSGSIELPLTYIDNLSYGPLSLSTLITNKAITGITFTNLNSPMIFFGELNGAENGELMNGGFSIIFSGY